MEDSDLGPILQRIYVAMRQMLEMNLELLAGFQTLKELSKDGDPDFERKYAKKFEELQSGALGQGKRTALAQFDQVLGVMKNWNR